VQVKRRGFITFVGGAAVTWPLSARAQQAERLRRIGVLMVLPADDPETQVRLAAFAQGLQQLGWTTGKNVRVDYRWGRTNPEAPRNATEWLALTPDAILLAHSSAAVSAVLGKSRTVPIVFTIVADPVGAGYLENLAHPGGSVTGFTNFEYGIAGKWHELLKEVVRSVRRVAVVRDPATLPARADEVIE